jgi:hypothetical protein
MPNGISDAILPVVPQLIGILAILCNVPDLVTNNPSRVSKLFQKALGLLCALFYWGRSSKGSKTE